MITVDSGKNPTLQLYVMFEPIVVLCTDGSKSTEPDALAVGGVPQP